MTESSGSVKTIWGCVGLLFLLVMGVCIILPAVSHTRRSARSSHTPSAIRGIHQACILHSHGNNGWFPGFDRDGNAVATSVEERFTILLEEGHFTGTYMISPSETLKAWSAGPVTTANYSFAMLQLPSTGGRNQEWRNTNNAEAAVISDRTVPNGTGYKSVHTNPKRENVTEWRGLVAWNDNHVTFEADFTVDTDYDGHANTDDNLFASDGTDDAYMIYSGNE